MTTAIVSNSGLTLLTNERTTWPEVPRPGVPHSVWTTVTAEVDRAPVRGTVPTDGSAVLSVLTLVTERIDDALKDISEVGVVEYVWEFADGSAASCVFDDRGNVDIWIEDSDGSLVLRDDARGDGRLAARSSVMFQKKVLGGRLAS